MKSVIRPPLKTLCWTKAICYVATFDEKRNGKRSKESNVRVI